MVAFFAETGAERPRGSGFDAGAYRPVTEELVCSRGTTLDELEGDAEEDRSRGFVSIGWH